MAPWVETGMIQDQVTALLARLEMGEERCKVENTNRFPDNNRLDDETVSLQHLLYAGSKATPYVEIAYQGSPTVVKDCPSS